MRADFPQLAVATLTLDGVTDTADVPSTAAPFLERASARLGERPESEFPEVAAWRRAFSQMGLKPTQYRCASEALLRRFKKDGELPSIHPLVDLCNAVSVTYAIPIAVFDLDQVTGDLTVTHADGTKTAICPNTRRVLIVSEALHDTAAADVDALRTEVAEACRASRLLAVFCPTAMAVWAKWAAG